MSLSVAWQLLWSQCLEGGVAQQLGGTTHPHSLYNLWQPQNVYKKDLLIRKDDKLPQLWKKIIAILLGRCKVPLINRENRMEEGSWASKWKQLVQEEVTSTAHSVKLCIYANVPLSFCTSAQCKRHGGSTGGGKKWGQKSSWTHNREREKGAVQCWEAALPLSLLHFLPQD